MDLFPVRLWSQIANRRLRSVTLTELDYGAAAGLRALREAIADHVRTARGTRCGAEQVLVVAGAQQGLELISRVLLDPGDRGLVLGFSAVRPDALRRGMERLAEAIEAARRPSRPEVAGSRR